MTKFGKIVIGVLVAIFVGVLVYFAQREPRVVMAPETEQNIPKDVLPTVVVPNTQNDLISFSITPKSKLYGLVDFKGVLQGGYFFEGNIIINILDTNKNLLKSGYATATTDWMTSGPVDFSGNIDVTGLPLGEAYLEIDNDNASGLPENDKSILIPIIISTN